MAEAEGTFRLADHALVPPVDDEGFVVGFHGDTQQEELREFFRKYGFVVVRDALPEQVCADLQADIFRIGKITTVVGSGKEPVVDVDKLDGVKWRQMYGSKYNEEKGFLNFHLAETQASYMARQSPALHSAYAALCGTNKLWFKLDRFGIMRPTKGMKNAAGETVDRPDWKTVGFVHWDQNPWEEPEHARLQGVVAVSPHTNTSGGFHCIPGVHTVMKDYANAHVDQIKSGCLVDLLNPDDSKLTQKITMRRGSMVIWDSRLPHGNWPNDDDKFRLVLYHTYFPAQDYASDFMRVCSQDFFDENDVELTPLGRKICGLDHFEDADDKDLKYREPVFPINLDSKFNVNQWGLPPPPVRRSVIPEMLSYPACPEV